MTVIPCQRSAEVRRQILEFAEILKTDAHTLLDPNIKKLREEIVSFAENLKTEAHALRESDVKKLREEIVSFAENLNIESDTLVLGEEHVSERDFYGRGIFRGAIESIRGQFAAKMEAKREFVGHVLNYMQDRKFIIDWDYTGEGNRHDYTVQLVSSRVAVIELKGCLDGNNTNIFERPPNANEFIIWSVCTNPGSDTGHNAWSGIHTRLSAEIIWNHKIVDGLIIWDMLCGTACRVCPKLLADSSRKTAVGPYSLPPPCLYMLPATIPNVRSNPDPVPQTLADVEIMQAFGSCFGCVEGEVNYVRFSVENRGSDLVRTTRIMRDGAVQKASRPTAIRRS